MQKQDSTDIISHENCKTLAQTKLEVFNHFSESTQQEKLARVTKADPCPHCGKPDWCYRIGNLSVCNRDAEPSQGWERTSKTDSNNKPYYAPVRPKKQPRPKAQTEFVYDDRDGQPLIKVTRIDDGNGNKKIFQSHWDGKKWVKGLIDEVKAKACVYRYAEVRQAILEGKLVFFVEGEGIADLLWSLGIPATTTLGGAGKYRAYGNYKQDLEGIGENLVLSPDGDVPGLKHMEDINQDFPDAKWLYAPVIDWTQLPKAGGLDIKDWVEAGATADDILQAIEPRRFAKEREKQSKSKKDDEEKKIPPADKIARQIAREYQDKLAFNNEIGQWMQYEADYPGIWSTETDEYMESIVYRILRGKGIEGYNSHSYIINIVKSLRNQLIERKWNESSPKELLPFCNGVLEVATGKKLPHSPNYRLTWRLPRDHDEKATNWSGIDAYFDHLSQGNAAIKDLLLCYCNAVLKGRSDLQKFLHLIGLGGTGKGTFARLITDLIGQENIYSATLDEWCNNRFESANAYRKRLVVFWDEDKQTGKLGKFLSLTGGDWIRAEEKNKKAFQYRYDGMVLMLSNFPIFTGDSASRIRRRIITVPCNGGVSDAQRRDLNAEFQLELAAFTNYVLSIPDKHVSNVLSGLTEIPECTLEFWENRIRVDSIAAWVNNCVIYDPLAVTAIGVDRNEGCDGSAITTLFGSYNKHCRETGDQPKSNKNFSPDLLELCRSVLHWEVERKVTKTGKFIRGLRLRRVGHDDHIPTYDYNLMQKVTGGDGWGDGSGDGSQSSHSKEVTDGDGSNTISKENQKVFVEEGTPENTSIYSGEYIKVEVYPSPPVTSLPDKGFNPSPDPSPDPSPSITSSRSYSVGDTVEFKHPDKGWWMKGRVEAVEQDKGILIALTISYQLRGETKPPVRISRTDWLR